MDSINGEVILLDVLELGVVLNKNIRGNLFELTFLGLVVDLLPVGLTL